MYKPVQLATGGGGAGGIGWPSEVGGESRTTKQCSQGCAYEQELLHYANSPVGPCDPRFGRLVLYDRTASRSLFTS